MLGVVERRAVEDGLDQVAAACEEDGREEDPPFDWLTPRAGLELEVLDQPPADRQQRELVNPREDVPELTARGVAQREIVLEELRLTGQDRRQAVKESLDARPEIVPLASLRLAPLAMRPSAALRQGRGARRFRTRGYAAPVPLNTPDRSSSVPFAFSTASS